MNSREYGELVESYYNVYETEIGVVEQVDIYDEVLNFLLSEGCTLEESNYIMTYVAEQGMHPQEIVARGIANILGLDKPHPTEIFARGLKKMLYPNKPVEVKAPKPPAKPAAVKPATVKPNPYRPGATIRATGPNLDKFPELQRFADQGRKIAEPVARTAGALAALRNITPAGVAAAVMAPRPTGDATLTAAMKRGDVAPPAPKLPAPEKPKPVVKPTAKPAAKPATKPVAKPAVKPAAAKPETPKFGPIPPLPPLEKKQSIADTLKDIRGSIEKSKERQKKNEKVEGMGEGYELFDFMLEYLVAEGYADTNKAALAIMANMSEEWKQSIIEANAGPSTPVKVYDTPRGKQVMPHMGAGRPTNVRLKGV